MRARLDEHRRHESLLSFSYSAKFWEGNRAEIKRKRRWVSERPKSVQPFCAEWKGILGAIRARVWLQAMITD